MKISFICIGYLQTDHQSIFFELHALLHFCMQVEPVLGVVKSARRWSETIYLILMTRLPYLALALTLCATRHPIGPLP